MLGNAVQSGIFTTQNILLLGNAMAVLFRITETAYQTQYAEVRDRAIGEGTLLVGTPGNLTMREGTGHAYWYRVFYPIPGQRAETLVCKDGETAALAAMQSKMAAAVWMQSQVKALRSLGFQVADKLTARVLVELHNHGAFEAGMVLVGTLAYMAHLNELGARVVSSRTLDIDVGRNRPMKLAAPIPFLETMKSTGLPFVPVPGLDKKKPSTSIKLPGPDGLRVDVLVPGEKLGAVVAVPKLDWAAQSMPYYRYLLEEPVQAVALAGWQAIPVRLPQPGRMLWHKLYSSVKRHDTAKRQKDFQQAITLTAALTQMDPAAVGDAFNAAPKGMIAPVRPLARRLRDALSDYPEAADALCSSLEAQVLN